MIESVAIPCAFEIPASRYRDLDDLGILHKVIKGAMAEWPVSPRDIDGMLVHPSGGISGYNIYVHDRLVSELGLQLNFLETLNIGGATYLAMVNRAAMAIRTGRANAVLCIGAGKFLKPSDGGGTLMAAAISDIYLEHPYGTFIPALYGLIANEYMAKYDVTPEDLARVAVSARKWAQLNPNARMHTAGELTVGEVLDSRMICTPFHYLDCSLPADGGGAVLVTRADLACEWSDRPAYVLGYGECHGRGTLSDPGSLIETGAIRSGREAFSQAGMQPSDIDVAEIYDAFTSTPLILLENLGFCAPGAAPDLVQRGAIDPGGELPVNTYGGLLSFGHTGDACGMSLLTEGVQQVQGRAGARQVESAEQVLVHAYGGMMYDHATLILGNSP